MVAILGALLAGQISFAGESAQARRQVMVPNVIRMTHDEAVAKLKVVGLMLSVTSGSPQGGRIATQSPAAGAKVDPSSRVHVTFATAWTDVPNLVGLTRDQAISKLTAARLKFQQGSGDPLKKVTAQFPDSGSKLPESSPVRVVFQHTGPIPPLPDPIPSFRPVPNLVGLTHDQALGKLIMAKLKLSISGGDWMKGKVATQSPTAGKMVAEGTEVRVTYVTGMVAVPDLVGLTHDQALGTLIMAKLKLSVVSGNWMKGKVGRQDPPAGKNVAEGTEVRVTLVDDVAKVPNVVGLTYQSAKNAIERNGFTCRVGTASTAGKVLRQFPSAGSVVRPFTPVTIYFEGRVSR